MSVYDILIMNNHSDKIKGIHMKKTKEQHNERKKEIMEKCFECYAENGLTGTGIKALAAACNCTTGNLYCYFKNIDELILESTAYCMTKVEDDFMESNNKTIRLRIEGDRVCQTDAQKADVVLKTKIADLSSLVVGAIPLEAFLWSEQMECSDHAYVQDIQNAIGWSRKPKNYTYF